MAEESGADARVRPSAPIRRVLAAEEEEGEKWAVVGEWALFVVLEVGVLDHYH